MKTILDYLKENGKYTHDVENKDFTLELEGKVVVLKYHEHEWWIAAHFSKHVEDEVIFLLDENFGIEIRFCETCGCPMDYGYTVDDGSFYCCEECFEPTMDKTYGKENWRSTEHSGANGGYYEYLNNGEWEDTGIYYTEWY